MNAGHVWRRPDGLRWVEIQSAAVEPSGWRLMIPLVLTVGSDRARVHLLCSAPHDQLGDPVGELTPEDVETLQAAVQRLVTA